MQKTAAALFIVIAAWSLPCAALVGDTHRGVFADAGSFHAAALRAAERPHAVQAQAPGGLLFAALGLIGFAARRRWLALRVDD
jgi:MYXO-CTERM domain-containing protein